MRITIQIYSLKFHVYHIVVLITVITALLSYSWKFVPFDHLHPISLSSLPASGNHKSDLFLFLSSFFPLDFTYR